ncbi:MAG: N-acetylneuraminate synthase [Bacteroidia bacterium]|nr:N-acetylneuraminate synthase [Bacteroidia bacterium]
MSCLIIAEAGVNHNGDIRLAKKLVDAALAAGADYIKFQTFTADSLVTSIAKKAEYQARETGSEESQYSMLKRLELSRSAFVELDGYCRKKGIGFLSTPFDDESIGFLDSIGIGIWKVPSGEVTNYPYLVKIAETHKPVIMSTGMCNLDEISAAIGVLGQHQSGSIVLLHCTTEYPAPFDEVNLKAMDTLRKTFNLPVGYSDHTQGIEIPIAAVAMGAVVIEKHFTLNKNMDGPDHKASLEPEELKSMVKAIRNIETAIGDGTKQPTVSERKNIAIARKSIVARRPIKQGEQFSDENIATKRPGTGLSPMRWNDVIGKFAKRSFEEDEMIEL